MTKNNPGPPFLPIRQGYIPFHFEEDAFAMFLDAPATDESSRDVVTRLLRDINTLFSRAAGEDPEAMQLLVSYLWHNVSRLQTLSKLKPALASADARNRLEWPVNAKPSKLGMQHLLNALQELQVGADCVVQAKKKTNLDHNLWAKYALFAIQALHANRQRVQDVIAYEGLDNPDRFWHLEAQSIPFNKTNLIILRYINNSKIIEIPAWAKDCADLDWEMVFGDIHYQWERLWTCAKTAILHYWSQHPKRHQEALQKIRYEDALASEARRRAHALNEIRKEFKRLLTRSPEP